MRYIRTKYGVIKNELVKRYKKDQHYFLLIPESKRGIRKDKVKDYLKKNIIKQADTIEELCDYAIVEEKATILSPKEIRFLDLKKYGNINGAYKKGYLNWVKYAILTDKGLIYVAKMNEKGELELL